MDEEAKKILAVDDAVQITKTLTDVLGVAGYSVRTAPSGERALQIMESANFDLVITDLKMTGMSGMDLAQLVFQRWPGVPVIILSGYGDLDSVIGALRSGVTDFIKKPFSADEVLSVVDRAIGNNRARASSAATQAAKGERPPRMYNFPAREVEQIDAALTRLRTQAGAETAMLIEEAGYIIAAKGLTKDADQDTLTTLIINIRSNASSLASMLGEQQDFAMTFMEGQRVSLYTTAVGRGLYLVIIASKGSKQGVVWLYAKEAATEIDRIADRVVAAPQPGGSSAPVKKKKTAPLRPPELKSTPANVSTFTFKKDKVESSTGSPAQTEMSGAGESSPTLSLEEAARLGLIHLGEGAAAEETPAPAAPEEAKIEPISFEEAMRRGLLNFGDNSNVQ
jgi:DNA-binding response OmpR family regulator